MKTEDRISVKERNNFMCKVKMKTILWDDENNKVEVVHVDTVCHIVWINLLVKTRNFSGHHTFFVPSAEIKKHRNFKNHCRKKEKHASFSLLCNKKE